MRILFTICLIYFFLVTNLAAQGAYLRAGTAYGIPANKERVGFAYNIDSLGFTREAMYSTSGGGPSFRLAAGYMFSPYVGLDCDFQYMHGSISKLFETYTSTYETKAKTNSLQARTTVSLLILGGNGRLKPYAKFGILLPLMGKTINQQSTLRYAENEEILAVTEAYGSFSIGFESSAGLSYGLTKKLSLYAEAYYIGLRIKAIKAEVVSKTLTNIETGVVEDLLEGATMSSTTINFVDILDSDSNLPGPSFDENKPMNSPAVRNNYNSFGLQLGVRYNFGSGT